MTPREALAAISAIRAALAEASGAIYEPETYAVVVDHLASLYPTAEWLQDWIEPMAAASPRTQYQQSADPQAAGIAA